MTDTPTTSGATAAVPSSVSAEVTVAVSVERAFHAFTTGFGAWWPREHHIGEAEMADGVIEPKVGGRWFERAADGTECDWGRVLAWDPPRHVGLSWHLNGEFEHVPDPDRSSRVDVRFTPVDGGTRVVLTHSGMDRHGPGWEGLSTGVASPNGWPGIVRRFADHLTEETS
ncbi:MAG: SRPBCC family protein [Aquihabitans sp.]